MKEENGEKYGYICMSCGKTIHEGVNEDGECEACINWRERKESKIEYAETKASQLKASSDEWFSVGFCDRTGIPMGQPILVGHHSEGRHRNAIKRYENRTRKELDNHDKSKYYEERAKRLENDTTISSDDPAAIKKLKEKIVKLENDRTKIKEYNKAQRAKGESGAYSYHLSNLGQNITSVKKRIIQLEKLDKVEEIEEKFNDITLQVDKEANRVKLFFPGKPEEAVRTKLKGRGFRWSPYNGCWQAYINQWNIDNAREIMRGEA